MPTLERRPLPQRSSFRTQATDTRFRFELAARLSKTVGQLEDEMGVREFEWWKALAKVEAAELERRNRT